MTKISDNQIINSLHEGLESAIVKGMEKDGTIEPGWQYQDHPQMLEKYWNYILAGYGVEGEDYKKITEARYEHKDCVYMRGQLLLGPNSRKNLGEYIKHNPIPE